MWHEGEHFELGTTSMFWETFECWAARVTGREESVKKHNKSLDHNLPNIMRNHTDEQMVGIMYYLITKVKNPPPELLLKDRKEYARQLRHGGVPPRRPAPPLPRVLPALLHRNLLVYRLEGL